MTYNPPSHTEVNKALTTLRKQTTACGSSATYAELYSNAERLQQLAFDFKQLIANGGTWENARTTE